MPDYLPQEFVDKIMSYVYDFKTLQSCLKVSRSWHDATVPKLTLKFVAAKAGPWIEPLEESSNSFLQFVKRYRIESDPNKPLELRFFTPERYESSHFFAFGYLQELEIDCLDLTSFMQELEKYFGRFAQSLQSLALYSPKASCRQMLSLIRIFKNLQDLKIYHFYLEDMTTADIPLAPLSTDAHRGQLTLHYVEAKFMEEMIKLYGGRLNFCFVDLKRVKCTQNILKACAGTLETLRVSEGVLHDCLNLQLHRDLFPSFKSLQTLVVNTPTAYSVHPLFHPLKAVVLANRLLNVVLVYQSVYFTPGCMTGLSRDIPDHAEWSTGIECARCDQEILVQFSKLWEIYKEREFRLVLCAKVRKSMVDRLIGILERNVEANKGGELGALMSQTSIISAVPSYIDH